MDLIPPTILVEQINNTETNYFTGRKRKVN